MRKLTLIRKLIEFSNFATVFCLIILIRYSAGPILEAYGIAVTAKYQNYTDMFPGIAGRPLTAIPVFLATKIAGLSWLGYAITHFILALIRTVLLMRITKSSKKNFALLLPFVVFLPPWLAITNERYMSAVLAFTLLFGALSCYLSDAKPRYFIVLLSFLSFLSYPPSIFCFAFSLIAFHISTSPKFVDFISKVKRDKYIFTPILLYILFLQVVKFLLPTSYDSSFHLVGIVKNIKNLTMSLCFTYKLQSLIILFFIVVIHLTCSHTSKNAVGRLLMISSLIFSTSTVYLQEYLHTNDPERIFFPIAVSLTLFYVLSLNRDKSINPKLQDLLRFSLTITILILSLSQVTYWKPLMQHNIEFREYVESQTSEIKEPFALKIVDHTGMLGDVNTFYANALISAVYFSNPNITSAEICTFPGITRFHPIAVRFPLPTTKYCETADAQGLMIIEIFKLNPLMVRTENQMN
jgi:hypothetical protein